MAAEHNKNSGKVAPLTSPSTSAVDAYKNYLYHSLHSYDSETFAAGKPIPVDEAEKDIAILVSKINQYQKLGFPAEEEMAKLKSLRELRDKVKGKFWPGSITAKTNTHACTHPQKTYIQMLGAVTSRCNKCSRTWVYPNVGNGPTYDSGAYELAETAKEQAQQQAVLNGVLDTLGNPIGSGPYTSPILPLKKKKKSDLWQPMPVMTPKSFTEIKQKTKKVQMSIGKAYVDQEFIMRMGMMSNCNVSIHKHMDGSYFERVKLHCRVCDAMYTVPENQFTVDGNNLPTVIGSFCTEHRHDPKLEEKVGRLFREE